MRIVSHIPADAHHKIVLEQEIVLQKHFVEEYNLFVYLGLLTYGHRQRVNVCMISSIFANRLFSHKYKIVITKETTPSLEVAQQQ